MDLFLASGEVWDTPILLGPLERANLNHCTSALCNEQNSVIEISSF
jgi:hypothetical protein